ncbi:hypothetical protein EZ456_07400 [Pedobacter psychrodurus]|uniref:Uncharacterized protein n=1 Tax=Pedobacter psychrodurus TaxID=2530456 RepID=A0A4R0Q809_9SPHI|nr:hypothetical protein [Pedobacter psychrodurus]TCD27766.1 hypothetical protein EZ456_07400 [Pedobacter psychrodurus]
MREYKYFKILDDILTHFNAGNLSIKEITVYWVGLNVDFPLDPFLDKLIKDGYISQHANQRYFITLDGSLLLESGGYVSKEKSKESLAERVEKNETRVRRATIWAAVVGGLLLIWEIVSFFLSKSFIEMIQNNINNFFNL